VPSLISSVARGFGVGADDEPSPGGGRRFSVATGVPLPDDELFTSTTFLPLNRCAAAEACVARLRKVDYAGKVPIA